MEMHLSYSTAMHLVNQTGRMASFRLYVFGLLHIRPKANVEFMFISQPLFERIGMEDKMHTVVLTNIVNGDRKFVDIDYIRWTRTADP
jgi:hypothetical protein